MGGFIAGIIVVGRVCSLIQPSGKPLNDEFGLTRCPKSLLSPSPCSVEQVDYIDEDMFKTICQANNIVEPPNSRFDHEHEGEYRCGCCGKPLFHGKDKCESGTGWPSFHTHVSDSLCLHRVKTDTTFKNNLRCSNCGANIGHAFANSGLPWMGKCKSSHGHPMRFTVNGVCLEVDADKQ